MSSIIKSPFVSFGEQKATIKVEKQDYHKILNNPTEKKVEENAREINQRQEYDELSQELEDSVEMLDTNEDVVNEVLCQQSIVKSHEEANKIIEEARVMAAEILEKAKEEGFEQGYEEGKQKVQNELVSMQQQMEQEIASAKNSYDNELVSLESKVAHIVINLVENLVNIQGASNDTIMYIIRKGLREVEIQEKIVVKVSIEDFDYVNSHREEINDLFTSKASIEIFMDQSLNKNDCIIETELGTLDCGLEGRLQGLLNELRLIQSSLE